MYQLCIVGVKKLNYFVGFLIFYSLFLDLLLTDLIFVRYGNMFNLSKINWKFVYEVWDWILIKIIKYKK